MLSRDKIKHAGLREGQDCSNGEWITMGVVIVRDPADGVVEDFNNILWRVFEIVCRTLLARIPQAPWEMPSGLMYSFRGLRRADVI